MEIRASWSLHFVTTSFFSNILSYASTSPSPLLTGKKRHYMFAIWMSQKLTLVQFNSFNSCNRKYTNSFEKLRL